MCDALGWDCEQAFSGDYRSCVRGERVSCATDGWDALCVCAPRRQ